MKSKIKKLIISAIVASSLAMTMGSLSASAIEGSISTFTYSRSGGDVDVKLINHSGSSRYVQVAIDIYDGNGNPLNVVGSEGNTPNNGNQYKKLHSSSSYTFRHRGQIYSSTKPLGPYVDYYEKLS